MAISNLGIVQIVPTFIGWMGDNASPCPRVHLIIRYGTIGKLNLLVSCCDELTWSILLEHMWQPSYWANEWWEMWLAGVKKK